MKSVIGVALAFLALGSAAPNSSARHETVRIGATTTPCAVHVPDRNNQGIRAGTYVIAVKDSSRKRYFAFWGKGVSRRTTLSFVGLKSWRVYLGRGTYRFRCGRGSLLQGTLRIL